MTINVSELFRNPERFVELEKDFIPALLADAPSRGLRVWSAGCSYGAEAVHARRPPQGGRAARAAHELVATDIDETILARARDGVFTEQDLANVSAERRRKWFEKLPDGGWQAVKELRSAVKFSRLDLLADPYPKTRDLILCRNVVIYFNDDAKEKIYERFFEALRPGGVLFIGSTERGQRLGDASAGSGPGTFFYRRPVRDRAGPRPGADAMTATASASGATQQLVTFALDDEEVRHRDRVRAGGSSGTRPRARCPAARPTSRASSTCAAAIIPVMDLRARLGVGGAPPEDAKVVITEFGDATVGVVVDDVREVITIDLADTEAPPPCTVGGDGDADRLGREDRRPPARDPGRRAPARAR